MLTLPGNYSPSQYNYIILEGGIRGNNILGCIIQLYTGFCRSLNKWGRNAKIYASQAIASTSEGEGL
jgi:hypothetical protein